MGESLAAGEADRFLRAAYHGKRERQRAIGWLGWIAYRVDGRQRTTTSNLATKNRAMTAQETPPMTVKPTRLTFDPG